MDESYWWWYFCLGQYYCNSDLEMVIDLVVHPVPPVSWWISWCSSSSSLCCSGKRNHRCHWAVNTVWTQLRGEKDKFAIKIILLFSLHVKEGILFNQDTSNLNVIMFITIKENKSVTLHTGGSFESVRDILEHRDISQWRKSTDKLNFELNLNAKRFFSTCACEKGTSLWG